MFKRAALAALSLAVVLVLLPSANARSRVLHTAPVSAPSANCSLITDLKVSKEIVAFLFKANCTYGDKCGNCWCDTSPVFFASNTSLDVSKLTAAQFIAKYQKAGLDCLNATRSLFSESAYNLTVKGFTDCTTYLPAAQSAFNLLSGPGQNWNGTCDPKAIKRLNTLGGIPNNGNNGIGNNKSPSPKN